jgi:hypothetical protein
MNIAEIELLNKTEEKLLKLMAQYKSGQYSTLAECIDNVRFVRDQLILSNENKSIDKN